MFHYSFLFGSLLLLVILVGTRCSPLPDDDSSSSSSSSSSHHQPPNIVLVYPHFSNTDVGYNNEDVITPNIDELAQSGVILDRFYTARLSTAVRAQTFTGRHANTLGLQSGVIRPTKPYGMPLEVPTLMDHLQDAGYVTHGLGKWHLGGYKKEYTPTYRGFDTFYGFHSAFTMMFNHSIMCPNNASDWGYDFWDSEGENLRTVRPQDVVGSYQTLLYGTRAVRIIDRHDKAKPLFMSVSPFDPAPSGEEGPQIYVDLYDHMTNTSMDYKRRLARTTVVDDVVGSIVEALKFNGMWKNTVFIFAGKTPTAAFVASPLLSATRQGAHVADPIHSCDLYSTMLHLADIHEAEEGLYGMNIWDSISEGAPGPRTGMLHFIDTGFELEGIPLYNDTFDTRIEASLMEGDLKINTGSRSGLATKTWIEASLLEGKNNTGYGIDPDKNYWLYNITADPLQHQDLSELPAYHAQFRAMLHTLEQWRLKSAFPLDRLPSSASDPAACPRHHGGFYVPWK